MNRIGFKSIIGIIAVVFAVGISLVAVLPSGQIAGTYLGGPGYHPCTNPGSNVSTSPSAEFGFGGANVVSTDGWDNINIDGTMSACHINSWKYVSNEAESGDNGAVQLFADSNETLASATPLSSIQTMTSNYRAYGAPSCTGSDYEYAGDDWWGGSTEWSGPSTEMMIWAYTCNQVPAGNKVATVSLDGHTYSVWVGGTPGSGNIITFESTSNYKSDHTNLLAFADWAEAHGYLPNAYLWQKGTGAEICYTNGEMQIGLQAFNLVINGEPAVTAPREPAAASLYKTAFNLRLANVAHT